MMSSKNDDVINIFLYGSTPFKLNNIVATFQVISICRIGVIVGGDNFALSPSQTGSKKPMQNRVKWSNCA